MGCGQSDMSHFQAYLYKASLFAHLFPPPRSPSPLLLNGNRGLWSLAGRQRHRMKWAWLSESPHGGKLPVDQECLPDTGTGT